MIDLGNAIVSNNDLVVMPQSTILEQLLRIRFELQIDRVEVRVEDLSVVPIVVDTLVQSLSIW